MINLPLTSGCDGDHTLYLISITSVYSGPSLANEFSGMASTFRREAAGWEAGTFQSAPVQIQPTARWVRTAHTGTNAEAHRGPVRFSHKPERDSDERPRAKAPVLRREKDAKSLPAYSQGV